MKTQSESVITDKNTVDYFQCGTVHKPGTHVVVEDLADYQDYYKEKECDVETV